MDPFSLLFFLHGAGPEVLFVALGLLGVGRAMKRGAQGRRRALPHPPPPPGERSRLNEARRALPRLQQLDTRRLPASLRLKVAQIRRKIETLLRHADEFPVGSEDLYVLQRTATEYLPSTLNAYLAMPPGSENAPVDAEGRTAWRILWDQLALIESRLDTVAADVRRRNADRLVANGRFLEERFKNLGKSELDLKDSKKPESDR